MNFSIFALVVSHLGNGVSTLAVNIPSMIDLGTINFDGVGTIHVMTPWAGNIEVNILPFPSKSFPSFTLA
jgi:acetate kinase